MLPPHPDVTLDKAGRGCIPRDHELAWLLIDHIASVLAEDEKTAIYVELGCGSWWEAITHMLKVTVRDKITVPEPLIGKLTVWLDAYVGTVDEPATRELLHRLQREHIDGRTPPNSRSATSPSPPQPPLRAVMKAEGFGSLPAHDQ